MEHKTVNVRLRGNISIGIGFVISFIFILGFLIYTIIEDVYSKEYFISPNFNNSLIVDKSDNFIFGKLLYLKSLNDSLDTDIDVYKCTGLHHKLYDIGDVLKSKTWSEVRNEEFSK